jgi:hypothetical protein
MSVPASTGFMGSMMNVSLMNCIFLLFVASHCECAMY